jgi:hypothetical protein
LGKAEYKVEGGKLVKAQVERKDDRILRLRSPGTSSFTPRSFLKSLRRLWLESCLMNPS